MENEPAAAHLLWTPVQRVANAVDLAARAHRDQRRKNRIAAPYINHPIAVMRRLTDAGVTDADILAAAALHDVDEDTSVKIPEIRATFGDAVANIVAEVTDDKTTSKTDRKIHQITAGREKSLAAKLVKTADKLDNLADLAKCPPEEWTEKRVQGYFCWSKAVVDAMGYCVRTMLAEDTEEHSLEKLFFSLEMLFEHATIKTSTGDVVRCLPAISEQERRALCEWFIQEGHSEVREMPKVTRDHRTGYQRYMPLREDEIADRPTLFLPIGPVNPATLNL